MNLRSVGGTYVSGGDELLSSLLDGVDLQHGPVKPHFQTVASVFRSVER